MSANQHLIYDPLTIKDTSTGGGPLGGTGSRPRQVCKDGSADRPSLIIIQVETLSLIDESDLEKEREKTENSAIE